MATAKNKDKTIAPGFWMALTLGKGTAPLRSYVGQVQAVDANGIRLTLIDWVLGSASGSDLYVSWSNIEAALVETPDHDLATFGERAAAWQTAVLNHASDNEGSAKQSKGRGIPLLNPERMKKPDSTPKPSSGSNGLDPQ